MRLEEGLGENWQAVADDERKLAIVPRGEDELHLMIAELLDRFHARIIGAKKGMPLAAQRLEGKHHVIGGDRRTVVEAGFGAKREDDPGAVGRRRDPLGDEPVSGGCLVLGVGEQRLEGETEARRRNAFENVGVEVVEGADRRKPHVAALRGMRIDVIEMGKAGRVFELAVNGKAVGRNRFDCWRRCRCERRGPCRRRRRGKHHHQQPNQDAPDHGGGRQSHGSGDCRRLPVPEILRGSLNRALRSRALPPKSLACGHECVRRPRRSPARRI